MPMTELDYMKLMEWAKDILTEPRLIKEVFWGADRGLGGTPSCWLYKCEDKVNYSSDIIELALPKEEWVDVTGECSVKIITHHVEIYHNGLYVLGLGGGFAALTCDNTYKVEVNPEASCCGHFTIYNKVTK